MRGILALFLAAVLAAGLLTGCDQDIKGEEASLRLWFPTSQTDLYAAMDTCGYAGEETIPGLMDALLSGPPAGSALIGIIPPGTSLMTWSLEDRVAQIALSDHYAKLDGVDRTLANYCIALTLAQLDNVDGVQIVVDGQGPTRTLQAGDVVFSGAEEEPVEVSAALYFRLGVGGTLGYELRVFRLTEGEAPAKAVLDALCDGPRDAGLTALLPEGVSVFSAWTDDGVCYADFSATLLEAIPDSGEEQELVISSIVETLCSLDGVNQVQILLEGETGGWYGSVDLSAPLFPSA